VKKKKLCVWYVHVFLFLKSGNFMTCTIILLIFIRRVHMREKGGKERKRWGVPWEKESCSYV